MGLYWIALAMIFCSLLGYRVALENRLSGVTGVLFGVGISGLVATEVWRFGIQAVYTSSLLASLIAAAGAALGATLLLHKFKILAYAKLIGWLVPVSVASIGVPSWGLGWQGLAAEKTPLIQEWSPQADADQVGRDPAARTVQSQTRLFRKVNGTFIKTAVVLRPGVSLEVGEKTTGSLGGDWIRVRLVRRDRTFEGFVPVRALR